jgi:hypothetical protein
MIHEASNPSRPEKDYFYQPTPEDDAIVDQCPDYSEMGLTDLEVSVMTTKDYIAHCREWLRKTNQSNNSHWFYKTDKNTLLMALEMIDFEKVTKLVEQLNETESSPSMIVYNQNLAKRVAFGQIEIPDILSKNDLKKLPDFDEQAMKFIGNKRKLRHLINIFFAPLNGRRVRRKASVNPDI